MGWAPPAHAGLDRPILRFGLAATAAATLNAGGWIAALSREQAVAGGEWLPSLCISLALCLASVATLPRPPRGSLALVLGCQAVVWGVYVIGQAHALAEPPAVRPGTDLLAYTHYAAELFLHGENPYAHDLYPGYLLELT